jgi:hypothetical protein
MNKEKLIIGLLFIILSHLAKNNVLVIINALMAVGYIFSALYLDDLEIKTKYSRAFEEGKKSGKKELAKQIIALLVVISMITFLLFFWIN